MDELWRLSACEMAQRVARREVSALELTNAHIARMEAVNPALNAVVVPLFDEARVAAKGADKLQSSGAELGALHGVPITIKEAFHVAGTPSTMGLKALATKPVENDGPLVARLRAAGAIILGKTNVPQLMLLHETDNPVYGRTNNPWDVERTPGGSSGGEAAIIAAGGSAAGLASDLGGSIRIPAHFCGIAGMKPSSHRLTKRGSVANLRGLESLQWQPGPLARHVADVERLLQVLVGNSENSSEPDIRGAPLRSSSNVPLRGLRVAYWEDSGFFGYAPAVKRAVREAVGVLAGQGVMVEPIEPPRIAEAMFLYTATLAADGAADAERLLRGSKVDSRIAQLTLAGRIPGWLRPLVAWGFDKKNAPFKAGLVRTARPRSADEYWQLTYRIQQFRQKFLDDFAAKYDALILPGYALPATPHRAALDLIPAAADILLMNLLGVPSGVVPVTRVRTDEQSDRPLSRELAATTARKVEQNSAGLPIGVQVVSHFWREDIVLAVMQAIETGCRASDDFPTTPVELSKQAPS